MVKKRSRQSDIENIEVIVGNFAEDGNDGRKVEIELEVDLESRRLHKNTSQTGDDFRSLLNTNSSANRGLQLKLVFVSELCSQGST